MQIQKHIIMDTYGITELSREELEAVHEALADSSNPIALDMAEELGDYLYH